VVGLAEVGGREDDVPEADTVGHEPARHEGRREAVGGRREAEDQLDVDAPRRGGAGQRRHVARLGRRVR
jgi:hypothetical protein